VTDRPPDLAPYIGPRPFSPSDCEIFFGRDSEIAELVSLVIANRAVLVYAVSGAGKSSLLSAGLIAALQARSFEVLPPLRLQAPAVPPAEVANAFTYSALWGLLQDPAAPAEAAGFDPTGTLTDLLASLPRGSDSYGFPSPRVLIFDQFEEIFTLHQDRWQEREALLRDIGSSLLRDPELRLVLALREEYVAQLERYAHLFPDGLRSRLHVERLRRDPALAAATGPLARAGVKFGPGIAEALITDLLQTRVDLGDGRTVTVEGEFVEPVQLQVVCRTLWTRLDTGIKRIAHEHLAALGSVDESLVRYYDQAVAAAVGRTRVHEHQLRDELERAFITPAGTRATVFAGTDAPAALPSPALDELRSRHVIRAEWRAGGQWVELSHDRLIEPIRRSNATVRERYAAMRRRRLGILTAILLLLIGAGTGLLFGGAFEQRPPARASLASLIAAYPGDDASRKATVRWMGRAAQAASIPPELPVMTALVESGLKNLQAGDADSIGFFQMEKGMWNRGPFAGFWRNPPVQLRWFINQAITVPMDGFKLATRTSARARASMACGLLTSVVPPVRTADDSSRAFPRREHSSSPPAFSADDLGVALESVANDNQTGPANGCRLRRVERPIPKRVR
jgi:hypothetical protein